jgi:hypothetical protein
LRRLADAKMTIFVRAPVCVSDASSGLTHLRVGMNWGISKQQNKQVQRSVSYYIQFFLNLHESKMVFL